MHERDTVGHWLREIGQRIGARLELDADGVCPLTYAGGQELVVAAPDGAESVVLHAPVATCPSSDREAFFERVLKLALMSDETGGAALGLDAEQGVVVLAHRQALAGLDARRFETLLANFIATAERVRTGLAVVEASPSERRRPDETAWMMNLNMRA